MSERRHTVLFLSLRADFGGGPEHLWRLLQHTPESFRAYVACPNEYPYYDRYREIVGSDGMYILPHRRFRLRSLWGLRRFCRDRGISILHAHGKGAGLYARLAAISTGLPCVYTFHGVHVDSYSRGKRYAYRLYERVMSLFTRAAITVSKGERARILAEGLMPKAKLRLIPNGVNIPDTLPDKEKPLSPPYLVVTLSRFDYAKNSAFLLDIAEALEAKNRFEDFRFVAVGDGPDRQVVAHAAKAKGWENNIACVGTSTEPHTFFHGAMCYLSTSRWEGMPLAVLEAMAHGLPVVASDVVGNWDAVNHGKTGFLYPEGDARAAAEFLCRLADDPSLRCMMGGNARAYVQHKHSIEEMAAKTFDLLRAAAR